MHVKVLALMLLRSDCSPAMKLQQLQELATAASPPEDQPVCSTIHSAIVFLPLASHAPPDRQPDACMGCPALGMCLHVQLQPPLAPCILLVIGRSSVLRSDDSSRLFRLSVHRVFSGRNGLHFHSQADLLDEAGALALAAAMREVDPEKLGAAAAVPLVIALMQHEWDTKDQVGNALSSCDVCSPRGGTVIPTIACTQVEPL